MSPVFSWTACLTGVLVVASFPVAGLWAQQSALPAGDVTSEPTPGELSPTNPEPGISPTSNSESSEKSVVGEFHPAVTEGPGFLSMGLSEPLFGLGDWSEWDSSFELGVNGSSGNSDSFNLTTGFDFKRSSELTETKVAFKYINNQSDRVRVAHNARLSLDWEKKFGDRNAGRFEPSRWSWFVKNNYFYDEFRPFDLRVAINSGWGYRFLEDDIQMFKSRVGAGASREFGGLDDQWIPEALFGLDYRRKISRRQKLEATLDYFPSWENFADYRVVTDVSWEFLLDEETNLSLKLNLNDQYDSTPDGARANDIFYSLLLLWKF